MGRRDDVGSTTSSYSLRRCRRRHRVPRSTSRLPASATPCDPSRISRSWKEENEIATLSPEALENAGTSSHRLDHSDLQVPHSPTPPSQRRTRPRGKCGLSDGVQSARQWSICSGARLLAATAGDGRRKRSLLYGSRILTAGCELECPIFPFPTASLRAPLSRPNISVCWLIPRCQLVTPLLA